MTRIYALAAPETVALAPIELHHDLATAEVILVGPRYGADLRNLLPSAKAVRWIHALAAGVEVLPLDIIRVPLTNSRGLYGDALAEFAIAAMLWFARDLRRLDRNQTARRWDPFSVERLEGKSVSIIGYGGIGKAVGRRADAMGMRVSGVTRLSRMEEMNDLIASSDYVVLSTPLTDETRGLMSRERLRLLRDHAVLINIGRGPVVDEPALIDELARIKGAALDVFETEPLPASSPLWAMENVLISPHSADRTADSHARAVAFFLENLARFEQGEPLENLVDPFEGY